MYSENHLVLLSIDGMGTPFSSKRLIQITFLSSLTTERATSIVKDKSASVSINLLFTQDISTALWNVWIPHRTVVIQSKLNGTMPSLWYNCCAISSIKSFRFSSSITESKVAWMSLSNHSSACSWAIASSSPVVAIKLPPLSVAKAKTLCNSIEYSSSFFLTFRSSFELYAFSISFPSLLFLFLFHHFRYIGYWPQKWIDGVLTLNPSSGSLFVLVRIFLFYPSLVQPF